MQVYGRLELSEICDLLASFTSKYTRMISFGKSESEEFLHIKSEIERMQSEINMRNLRSSYSRSEEFVNGLTRAIV